ncbi:MAG: hypothetical protein SFV17_05420 [Candidatus Obscuribacter sp.]|nr:hypothetical protein [Candidatus Obscuribacter sp.]
MQTKQATAQSAVSGLTVWQGDILDDNYQETESRLYSTFAGAAGSLDLSKVQRVQHLDVSELSVAELALLIEFLSTRTSGASLNVVYNNCEGKEETFSVNSRQVNS